MNHVSTNTLQGLLDRLRAGEEAAGHELFQLIYRRLEGMTRKMKRHFQGLARWEDTETVWQEAALRLWEKIRRDPPATVPAFFGDAARKIRDTLIDLLRKYYGAEGPGGKVVSDGEGDSSATSPRPAFEPGTDTADPALLAELTEIHCQIEALPQEERQVVDLIWYHDLTQQQVADVLGVSLRTVKYRWQSARLRLGQWFVDNLPEA
jgi:RNA polymerase sigma-70 factor (ECF subfamily)